ncbi:uncharacterized protein HMPREF1541_00914 [Cyphellophora europaea CBS 101466]|uniref:Uncharacterized protein n=1 Tax=Cyphellophora europaea (strain CBS 101466) TaxID=1220924 RepID=W2SDM5_CYPE1|nr:uncharacterized protein HMPREF1541_00914 [Cyphellophora europaea CBS 101466]ETN46725.1 hypothetical protein HMPREF1541_00914 [Cyphellophora europaea CBS 101466]
MLAYEQHPVEQTVEEVIPGTLEKDGPLDFRVGCSINNCGEDFERPSSEKEDRPLPFHLRRTNTPDLFARPLKSFSFHERASSSTREPRRLSSSTSPRTRSSPMYLTSLPAVGISIEPHWAQGSFVADEREERLEQPRHSHSWPSGAAVTTTAHSAGFGVAPLLTPPEDAEEFTWTIPSEASKSPRQESLSSDLDNQRVAIAGRESSDQSTTRPSTITLPPGNMMDAGGIPSTWLGRAIQVIVSVNSDLTPNAQMHMVVQAMPPHVERPRTGTKLIFEEVVQSLQRSSTNVPYVTITHTYTDHRPVSLEEIPDSPPATPNIHDGSDYFDNNTIFTHVAQVPDYHKPSTVSTNGVRNPKVAAPSSVNVSTIERYIPPTTADEVRDLFSISRRSHLVDRLGELSATQNGTLLLVYPTKAGGQTFSKWYKDPILDPLLRRFMMLRGLTTPAGAALGRLESVDSLMDFDQMQTALRKVCGELAPQLPPVGGRSQFIIDHAEKAEVILDRQTWIELFLTQESSRMRQDLIDYQKSGQRMPASGFEASPAALAREVEDGIRSSKEHAGGIGIEVGVFVIRRSLI